jgi:hypothetical protein
MQFPISDPIDIRELQQRLSDAGFDVTPDGVMGPKTRAAIEAFQSANVDATGAPLTVDGIPGPATWASLLALGSAAPVAPASAITSGFDTAFYPGDVSMKTWKQASPYTFVGYYLAAPVHPNPSWMGKRATLTGMGWGLLPVYVGRQAQGPGSNVPPDAASGHQHGLDALAKMHSEGFPPGSRIYLDVEPTDQIPAGLIDYINAWLSQFQGQAFLPGIYCHIKNAAEISAKTAQTTTNISFWVSGSGSFTAGTSSPVDSGIAFAKIWQGTFNIHKTFGGVTIQIDENVAFTSSL